jgi:two-component system chemotaxis response regulator CheB
MPARAAAARREPVVTGRPSAERAEILAIGCSTGGPDALSQVLKAFPATVGVPIVVVQHMPPVFTKMFAERLNRLCALDVVEAAGDEPLRPGTVYIAPGDFHLEVVRKGATVMTKLQSGPAENFCRPAVDVLFRSVAQVYGGRVLVAVLTGMGQDGKRGADLLRTAGAEIVVQDEATSVVWGMPGSIAGAGLAHTVLALPEIAGHLISRTAGDRPTRSLEVTR